MLKPIASNMLAVLVMLAIYAGTSAQTNPRASARTLLPQPAIVAVETDRVKDGLVGPVRRVRTEIVKLVSLDGKVAEGKRALIELVAYDINGNKTENQYFPIAGATLTGKEVYKYDEKGNISEMTMLNNDGSLLSKELYKYDFDFAGNWNKMTASVAVVDAGKVISEPAEVTYRSIMYYLDANTAKLFQPGTPPASGPPALPNNMVKPIAEAKVQQTLLTPIASKVSASSTKVAPSLPSSSLTADKLDAMNSVEVRRVLSMPDSEAPLITLDSEPPPSPAPKPIPKSISGGVLNGTALELPPPTYPDTAKRMRISGLVSVSVVLDETGKVISAEATSGPAQLRPAATQAALRARFTPTKLSGQPVKVSGIINYKFALQ